MKESELRAIIREHVKKTLKEAGPNLGAGASEFERGLDKVDDRASRLSKKQRIQAVIPVLQKFGITSNDVPLIKAVLAKMNKAAAAPAPIAIVRVLSPAEFRPLGSTYWHPPNSSVAL